MAAGVFSLTRVHLAGPGRQRAGCRRNRNSAPLAVARTGSGRRWSGCWSSPRRGASLPAWSAKAPPPNRATRSISAHRSPTSRGRCFAINPVFGVGFGRFYDRKLPYLSDRSQNFELESIRPLHHHNTLLSVLTETGLVGLAAFVAMLGRLDAQRLAAGARHRFAALGPVAWRVDARAGGQLSVLRPVPRPDALAVAAPAAVRVRRPDGEPATTSRGWHA